MVIEFENEEIENLEKHKYTGKNKKNRSNDKLIRNLDKVIKFLSAAEDIVAVGRITSLHYEPLTGIPNSSVRVGFDTKYRLIFNEKEDKLTLLLLELNEHYGDH